MSALDRVRKKFGNLGGGTDKGDKSPSVSSVAPLSRKTEKLQRLPGDLERRIRAMGQRWQYTDADLAEAMQCAAADPAAWLRAVQWDEELHRVGPDLWTDADQQFYGRHA